MALDKETLENWLKDYLTYWSTLPSPENFNQWDSIGQTIDLKLSDLKSTLNGIDDDQLKALASFYDKGDNGNPQANPPIPPTPPQPYMIKLIALCIISGPIWIVQRLNYLLPTAGVDAGTMNWLFNEFINAVNSAKTWYLSKNLQTPIGAILDLWFHGSDADILKKYPSSQNTHSIDTLWNTMKLLTMLDDGSTSGKVQNPTPESTATMVNAIINIEAN